MQSFYFSSDQQSEDQLVTRAYIRNPFNSQNVVHQEQIGQQSNNQPIHPLTFAQNKNFDSQDSTTQTQTSPTKYQQIMLQNQTLKIQNLSLKRQNSLLKDQKASLKHENDQLKTEKTIQDDKIREYKLELEKKQKQIKEIKVTKNTQKLFSHQFYQNKFTKKINHMNINQEKSCQSSQFQIQQSKIKIPAFNTLQKGKKRKLTKNQMIMELKNKIDENLQTFQKQTTIKTKKSHQTEEMLTSNLLDEINNLQAKFLQEKQQKEKYLSLLKLCQSDMDKINDCEQQNENE